MPLLSKKNKKNASGNELLIQKKNIKVNTILYKQNDTDTDMYILINGKCGVYVDDEFITEINEPNAIIGESAALFKQPRSATIIALENCELSVIAGEYVDKVILENPKIGVNLLKTIAKRLHNTSKLAAHLQKIVFQYKTKINKLNGEKIIEEDFKLGRLFYETGIIKKKHLNEVLKLQEKLKKSGKEKSIGQLLIEKGHATMFQVMQVINLQKELQNEKKIVKKLLESNDNNKK